MLVKLFKYEIKSTFRLLIPLFLSLIVLAMINKGFMIMTDNIQLPKLPITIAQGILAILITLMIVATVAMTFITMIQRFYKNLLGDEGYLMFTLPVKPGMHIIAKTLASMLWIIASAIAVFISLLIIFANLEYMNESINRMNIIFHQFYDKLGVGVWLVILEYVVLLLVSLGSSVLMIYASIAVGHLVRNHRILASFGAYIGISTITQIIATVVAIVGMAVFSKVIDVETLGVNNIHIIFVGITLLTFLFTAGYYFITNLILSKRLNLE